ncbi:MAG TPA: hypothetical protein VNO35_22900 [Steroidobacteraceae bacterium]|nr:hypothetical protein [Steroidobacteraceae bacterium]
MVSPRLHHLPPLIEPLSPVVGRSDLVALLVRKLELDDIWRESQFAREGVSNGSKAVSRLLITAESERSQSGV